jgi:YggT family protein
LGLACPRAAAAGGHLDGVKACQGPFPRRGERVFVCNLAAYGCSMNPFLWLIDTVITIYIWILIAAAVLSWLIAFNVVNTRNQIVASIGDFLYRITEPALRPIRSVLPNLGGIDISPVILILGLLFLRNLLFWLLA